MSVAHAIARRASYPDDFTIEIREADMMHLGGAEVATMRESWIEVRAELIRRGYRVGEWHDNATMTNKARCVREKIT